MEPRVQYARTSDGVNIAYVVTGTGPPLVMASQIWGSLHMAMAGIDFAGYWSMDEISTLEHSVVLYDVRGTGSSDRRVPDYSLQARALDLEAVVRSTGCERFTLYGFGHGSATAIAFTAEQPAAVERLILCNPFISGSEYYSTNPPMRALKATESMATDEWGYLTRSLASSVLGFDDVEHAHQLALAFQSAMLPEDLARFRAVAESTDVGHLLGRIAVSTLVVRDNSMQWGQELARGVAAGIPGAQFISAADGKAAIRDVLGVTSQAQQAHHPAPSLSSMTAILFVDVVDSTALTERIGDLAFRTKARVLDVALRAIIRDDGGTTIDAKTLGDGVLATFRTASQAIDAALRCAVAGNEQGLPLHVGLHAGDVIREQSNVFGGAVNIAARISGLSAPGEVLVSRTVADLARTSAGVTFEDRGEHTLKGVGEPQRVYAVRPTE